jgi:DNA invertase Pin-like site-specific DNA recombinase
MKHKAILVVYSLSRLARNTKETIEIAEKMQKVGAHLSSVREPIDTTTAIGYAFFQIMAVLAELERKQISERTSDAMQRYQAAGRAMSCKAPFGWQRCGEGKKRLIENEDEQKIIRRVIKLRKDGLGLREIARRLKDDGVKKTRQTYRRQGKQIARDENGKPLYTMSNITHITIRSILIRAGLSTDRVDGKKSKKAKIEPISEKNASQDAPQSTIGS